MNIGSSELGDLSSDQYGSTDWRASEHDACHSSGGRFSMTSCYRNTFFYVHYLCKRIWVGCKGDFSFDRSNHLDIIAVSFFKSVCSAKNCLGIDYLVCIFRDISSCMSDNNIHSFVPEGLNKIRISISRTRDSISELFIITGDGRDTNTSDADEVVVLMIHRRRGK